MAKEMKESGGSAVGAVVGSAVLAAVCFAGGWIVKDMMPEAARAKKPNPLEAQGNTTVAVTNVETRAYNLPLNFVAHAEPVQEVDLLPQIDGYIKEMRFKEGDVVKTGDILYVLDDERYRAVANQRKANLEAAEAEARRAERYWERMQSADARGITQLERDNAEAGADKAKAAVLQARANLVVAEYDLKKALVTAPISGQIGKSNAHVGDYVAPSKGALAKIVQIDPIRVSFPLTDREYISWRQAQRKGESPDLRLRLLLPDGSEYDRTGLWDFDDNQMSRDTATIMMRLKFPNSERLLIPNSYVTLVVDRSVPPEYPSVPQQAVFDLPGGNMGVWIVKADGTAEARAVKTLGTYKGWTAVKEGLKAGEKVVISGVAKIFPGAKVTEVTPTPNEDISGDFKPTVK